MYIFCLHIVLFISWPMHHTECVGPYSIAGPLRPFVIHYRPTVSEIHESNKGQVASPETKTASIISDETLLPFDVAANIAAGYQAPPANLHKNYMANQIAKESSYPTSSTTQSVTASNMSHNVKQFYSNIGAVPWYFTLAFMDCFVVAATVLGMTYAALFGPTTWISFTARSIYMRYWYGGLISGTFFFFITTLILIDAFYIPPTYAVILSKFSAVSGGLYCFKNPNIGWVIGFILSSLILTRFLVLFLLSCTFLNYFISFMFILALQFLFEQWFQDVVQSLITSSTAAFISTSCLSYMMTFFGVQRTSPYDFIGFTQITVNQFKTMNGAQILFAYFLVLTLMSTGIQKVRTIQGKTQPFPPDSSLKILSEVDLQQINV